MNKFCEKMNITNFEWKNKCNKNIIYVNQQNTNKNQNGLSWCTAFVDLQSALNKAALNQDITKIYVAAGTYIPSIPYSPNGKAGGAVNTTDPLILFGLTTFNIPDNTHIYGGYNGTEQDLCKRDYIKNKTILSGAAVYYHVITLGNDVAPQGVQNVKLDGLTITQGNAQGPIFSPTGTLFDEFQYAHNYGGGLYVTFESEVIVKNCLFINNNANGIGGAVFSINSNTSLIKCKFDCNRSNQQAGAVGIYNTYEQEPHFGKILACIFKNNTTVTFGGAIVVEGTIPNNKTLCKIIASEFYENYGQEGGAIVVDSLTVDIDKCLFKNNNSAINAGAVSTTNVVNTLASAAKSLPLVKFTTTITNSLFDKNVNQGNLALHNSLLGGPSGPFAIDFPLGGGALVNYINGLLEVYNCIFNDNITYDSNGGAILNGKSAIAQPPAFEVRTIIKCCKFNRNKAIRGNGGAIASLPSTYPFVPPLNITDQDTFIVVKNSEFNDNEATFRKDNIYVNNSVAIIKDNCYETDSNDNVYNNNNNL